MKDVAVSKFKAQCLALVDRVARTGEEIVITQRGKPVARLIPERPAEPKKVNWADSPAVTRDRSGEKILTAQESLDLIHDAASKW